MRAYICAVYMRTCSRGSVCTSFRLCCEALSYAIINVGEGEPSSGTGRGFSGLPRRILQLDCRQTIVHNPGFMCSMCVYSAIVVSSQQPVQQLINCANDKYSWVKYISITLSSLHHYLVIAVFIPTYPVKISESLGAGGCTDHCTNTS